MQSILGVSGLRVLGCTAFEGSLFLLAWRSTRIVRAWLRG